MRIWNRLILIGKDFDPYECMKLKFIIFIEISGRINFRSAFMNYANLHSRTNTSFFD